MEKKICVACGKEFICEDKYDEFCDDCTYYEEDEEEKFE